MAACLGVSAAIACAHTPGQARRDDGTGAQASAPVGIAAAAPSGEPEPPADPSAGLRGEARAPSGEAGGVIVCGGDSCAVGEQTCCGHGERARCIDNVPSAPGADWTWEQARACNAFPEVALDGMARCDESADCPDGRLCCTQYARVGAAHKLCVDRGPAGTTPCDLDEACQHDAHNGGDRCHVKGTTCMGTDCLMKLRRRCGSTHCAETEICCGDPPSCKAPSDCRRRYGRYVCTSPRHCPAPQTCVVAPGHSRCTGFVQETLAPSSRTPVLAEPIACDGAADCPASVCPNHAPASCKPYARVPWITVCTCP